MLLRRSVLHGSPSVAPSVAPGNPYLGVMLPYTPLHHLIARDLDAPFVATSGNRADEPIARDTEEALERLGDIADCFLVHDRPIARRVDDTVGRVLGGRFRVLRRARGFAPEPVRAGAALPRILAVGAHQRAVVGIGVRDQVVLSQHLGDLDTPLAREGFEQAVRDLLRLYRFEPERVACDLHPDYASTRFAEALGCPVERVQHHHAHAASCLVDAGRWDGSEALAVTWDGTGYGTDGTVWGGEFLAVRGAEFRRVAHLRPFRLPGGEAAAREPARVLLALLWEMAGNDDATVARAPEVLRHMEPREIGLLLGMLRRRVNAPVTTSVGRLFDAMAALSGFRGRASFEGQAAMELEQALDPHETGAYPLPVRDGDPLVLDWGPLVEAAIADLCAGASAGTLSARFHNALVEATAAVAERVGLHAVALTGGCFQNAALTERTAGRLSRCGFDVLLHRQVPPNDGGIALGQIAVAAARQAVGRAGIPSGEEDRRVPRGAG